MKGTAEELTKYIGNRICPPKKRERRNWKKELKAERNRVIDEAITKLQSKLRTETMGMPEQFKRGYYSAISTLEQMKS